MSQLYNTITITNNIKCGLIYNGIMIGKTLPFNNYFTLKTLLCGGPPKETLYWEVQKDEEWQFFTFGLAGQFPPTPTSCTSWSHLWRKMSHSRKVLLKISCKIKHLFIDDWEDWGKFVALFVCGGQPNARTTGIKLGGGGRQQTEVCTAEEV